MKENSSHDSYHGWVWYSREFYTFFSIITANCRNTRTSERDSVEVDLIHLAPGEFMAVAWKNKSTWIIRRAQANVRQAF